MAYNSRSASAERYYHKSGSYSHNSHLRYSGYHKRDMVATRSSSQRRSASVSSQSALRSGRFSGKKQSSSRYLENAVVAFEEFGEAPGVLKLYEFRDKIRSAEKLKRNVVIKIEVRRLTYYC